MTRSRAFVFLAVLLLGTMLLATACGDDDDDDDDDATATATATTTATPTPTAGGGDASGATEVAVTLMEWAVEPDAASVSAGEVKFVVANDGTLDHEFVIVRSDEAADALPVDSAVVPEDEIEVVAEIEPYSAGTTEELTVNLTAGNYLLICNVAGHYELGMRTAFTVE